MVALLAIVVLGGWWALANDLTSDDDDAPPQPDFISAPPPAAYVSPATVEYKPGRTSAKCRRICASSTLTVVSTLLPAGRFHRPTRPTWSSAAPSTVQPSVPASPRAASALSAT